MTELNEKKYEINVDQTRKIVFASASGFFGPNDANAFVKDYTALIGSINAKEYELQFDAKNLKVSGIDVKTGIDMAAMLKGCLEMYKKDGFKKIFFNCGSSILKMQISRLSKEVGLANCEII